jgi:two-component sensor histidine kinase
MWIEADRLAALRRYGILDAPPDAAFDDFVQVAAYVCQVPVALVSLVDQSRQWFAAEIGLGVRQTSLDRSVCAEAIHGAATLVIADLAQDSRFAANALVAGGPRLRFYAGALLQTPDGLPLGTLCVLDDAPRPEGLTERQAFTLEALARQVVAKLELRRAASGMDALLAEKDLLVQEVHHRVKNSLATVQALLLLQARSALPGVAGQLQEAARRVRTFGTMHEHLYRTGTASEVDIAAYLQSLVDDQQAAFASASSADGRAITLEADSAPWPSSEAPILGLVVVELVTNALKYGKGTVKVALRMASGHAVLTVADEGQGLPAGFVPADSTGLGMRLIAGLLRGPRHGRLEIDRTQGHTCFRATMRAPQPEAGIEQRQDGTGAAAA